MYYLSYTINVLVCTIDKLLSTVHCTCKCKPAFALNGLFWLVNTKKTVQSYGSAAAYTNLNLYTTMIFKDSTLIYPAVYIINLRPKVSDPTNPVVFIVRRLTRRFTFHAIYNCKHVHYWILEIFELTPDFCGISLGFFLNSSW